MISCLEGLRGISRKIIELLCTWDIDKQTRDNWNIQKQPLQFFADEIQRTISLLVSIPLLAKASLVEIACCMYIRHRV